MFYIGSWTPPAEVSRAYPSHTDRRDPRDGRGTGRSFRPPAGPAVASTAGRIDRYGRRRRSPERDRSGTLRPTAPPRTRLRNGNRSTAPVCIRFELSASHTPPFPTPTRSVRTRRRFGGSYMRYSVIGSRMAGEPSTAELSRCRRCGFEAPGGDDQWLRLEVPKLGRMTQCPNCESTDVITRR